MSDEPHDPLAVLRVPPTAVEKAQANAWEGDASTEAMDPTLRKEGDY